MLTEVNYFKLVPLFPLIVIGELSTNLIEKTMSDRTIKYEIKLQHQ